MILALLACGGGVPEGSLELQEVAEIPLVDDVGSAGRPRRRMNVDQLSDAIEHVTGYAWVEADQRLFDRLSGTLGKPEFLDSTEEDLAPGLLFQKFLDDAANAVCDTLVERELAGTSNVLLGAAGPTDTRATNAAAVDAALAAALLRYHGRRVSPGDPQLDPWTLLFDSTLTVTGGDTMAAWRSVCIGLIVHPDFYQY
ncbi:MAG: hypothetical protein KC656_14235 [Myxococcales bacterium]|nr:hypothetical protein [Myxococcales bacterium]